MAVDQPIVDKVGVGQEVVLTLLGKSPIDDDVLNSNGESVQIDAESVLYKTGKNSLSLRHRKNWPGEMPVALSN
jgi:hypothetical protein